MNYKSVIITRKGPPSVLQVVENPLRAPATGEVRVKILYTGVGFTDVIMRYGYYPYAPKIPFAPGYEIIGIVDALGGEVSGLSVGRKVAALTVYGGYAEYIYLPPEALVAVPDGLDDVESVSLILNYVTAYQMLHRAAGAQPGGVALITGASGGVGNALLQLGRLIGLTMYGLASKKKHDLVEGLGGIPIDYRADDVAAFIRAREPDGLDVVFDGIGGRSAWRGYRLLRRGGILVSFGVTASVQNRRSNDVAGLAGFLLPALLNLLPDGRRATFYGITRLYRKDPKPFHEDLPKLFELLAERAIQPVIAGLYPLTQAAQANELLESGDVGGKLVLKCTAQGS
jgi:NADPH:quinone reductase-like Zn-dependent oxidoreductase